jgi:hypothetical protein
MVFSALLRSNSIYEEEFQAWASFEEVDLPVERSNSGLGAGAIARITIGAIVVIGPVVVGVFWFLRRSRLKGRISVPWLVNTYPFPAFRFHNDFP